MSFEKFNLKLPFPDLFPSSWKEIFDEFSSYDFMAFRNLEHFKYEVSMISQREDDKCDISYKDALKKLMRGESDFEENEQESIRNLVRSNLHKRGLITEEVYESFKYTTDGTQVGVDVGKYVSGEPDCVITPNRQYIDFFYELYISISYPYHITNEDVKENVAKLLATVEELERQHIFIKIVLVLPIRDVKTDGGSFFSAIPLFSHKDSKSVSVMSSVINERLLRKFYFAVLENLYKEELQYGYGMPVIMQSCMNIGNKFEEVEFFESVVKHVGA
jgi:hypothetical protein